MPPKAKISREAIIEAALSLAKKKGFAGITARSLARELGCSVAPIYVNFETMDDVMDALMIRITQISSDLVANQQGIDYFEKVGKASLAFAREYPVIFREMALQPSDRKVHEALQAEILDGMAQDEHLKTWSREELQRLLLKVIVFQMGLSLMVANHSLPLNMSDKEQEDLLMEIGEDFFLAQQVKREGKVSL